MSKAALMFDTKNQKLLTPADTLRKTLDKLEIQIGKLGHSTRDEAMEIPVLFDRAVDMLIALQDEDVRLNAELSRWETVTAQFEKKAPTFLREIGGASVLRAARQLESPDEKNWWWFVDQQLAEKRRMRLRRTGRIVLIVIAILVLLGALYMRFLAPSPEVRASFRHQQSATNLAMQGDYAAAYAEVQQALSYTPDEPDLQLLKGVIARVMGNTVTAEEIFSEARVLFEDELLFLSGRAQAYMSIGQPEYARADAEAMLSLDPESALGYLQLGGAVWAMGNATEAIVYYEKASELANAAGQTELEALARVQLSQVMMEGMAIPLDEEITPTPE